MSALDKKHQFTLLANDTKATVASGRLRLFRILKIVLNELPLCGQ
jgi:hypothetical protein